MNPEESRGKVCLTNRPLIILWRSVALFLAGPLYLSICARRTNRPVDVCFFTSDPCLLWILSNCDGAPKIDVAEASIREQRYWSIKLFTFGQPRHHLLNENIKGAPGEGAAILQGRGRASSLQVKTSQQDQAEWIRMLRRNRVVKTRGDDSPNRLLQ